MVTYISLFKVEQLKLYKFFFTPKRALHSYWWSQSTKSFPVLFPDVSLGCIFLYCNLRQSAVYTTSLWGKLGDNNPFKYTDHRGFHIHYNTKVEWPLLTEKNSILKKNYVALDYAWELHGDFQNSPVEIKR